MLRIKGPCCTCQFCADIEFEVCDAKHSVLSLSLVRC